MPSLFEDEDDDTSRRENATTSAIVSRRKGRSSGTRKSHASGSGGVRSLAASLRSAREGGEGVPRVGERVASDVPESCDPPVGYVYPEAGKDYIVSIDSVNRPGPWRSIKVHCLATTDRATTFRVVKSEYLKLGVEVTVPLFGQGWARVFSEIQDHG